MGLYFIVLLPWFLSGPVSGVQGVKVYKMMCGVTDKHGSLCDFGRRQHFNKALSEKVERTIYHHDVCLWSFLFSAISVVYVEKRCVKMSENLNRVALLD